MYVSLCNEGYPPNLKHWIAILRVPFKYNSNHHGNVHAVGNGVAALNGAPGLQLCRAELRFLMRVPADAGGIKNYLSAAKRSETRAFGIPLVPANLHTDARVLRIEIWKAQIPRREIKFLVIKRIVGN